MAILASNTLGTAFGDFLAGSPGRGFDLGTIGSSAVLLSILFAIIYWTTRQQPAAALPPAV